MGTLLRADREGARCQVDEVAAKQNIDLWFEEGAGASFSAAHSVVAAAVLRRPAGRGIAEDVKRGAFSNEVCA